MRTKFDIYVLIMVISLWHKQHYPIVAILLWALWLTCSKRCLLLIIWLSNLLTERTWWWLFQERVVSTRYILLKLDMYFDKLWWRYPQYWLSWKLEIITNSKYFKQYIPKQRYVQPCTMYEQQGYGILYINCNINAFFSFHLFIYQNVISR